MAATVIHPAAPKADRSWNKCSFIESWPGEVLSFQRCNRNRVISPQFLLQYLPRYLQGCEYQAIQKCWTPQICHQ